VTLNDAEVTTAELTQRFGGLASGLVQPRSLCVAGWIPAVLSVDDVAVRGDDLVVVVGAERTLLSQASFTQLGSCQEN